MLDWTDSGTIHVERVHQVVLATTQVNGELQNGQQIVWKWILLRGHFTSDCKMERDVNEIEQKYKTRCGAEYQFPSAFHSVIHFSAPLQATKIWPLQAAKCLSGILRQIKKCSKNLWYHVCSSVFPRWIQIFFTNVSFWLISQIFPRLLKFF